MGLDHDDVMLAPLVSCSRPDAAWGRHLHFLLSDFECDFLASMASNRPKPWNATEETLNLMWAVTLPLILGQNLRELSSSEGETMRNDRCVL